MGILLGLAPFIVFAVMTSFAAPAVCLWTAAAISALQMLNEMRRGRSLKVLEIGTVALFAGLGAYTSVTHAHWRLDTIRTTIDAGLLLIVLVSVLVRRPFTLQYAREQVPAAIAQTPLFLRVNYIITAVWAIAMTVTVGADLAQIFLPGLPVWTGTAASVAALIVAIRFTTWYPTHVRARAGALPAA